MQVNSIDPKPMSSRRKLRLPDGSSVFIAEDGWYSFSEDVESPAGQPVDPAGAFWELAEKRPPAASVEVIPIGVTAGFLTLILAQQNVAVGPDSPLRLVLTDDYLRPELLHAVLPKRVCLLAKPAGKTLWLGPLLTPGRGACLQCLQWWLTLNRYPQNALLLSGHSYAPDHAVAALPSTEAMAASWLASVTTLLLAGAAQPELENGILHFDTLTQRMSHSHINPRGGCPHCRDRSYARPPVARFEGRYTGLVHCVDSGQRFGVHVSIGRCMMSHPAWPAAAVVEPQRAGGKGRTLEEARTGCAAEALERYALVYQGNENLITASAGKVEAIHPNELLCCSARQYAGRSEDADDFSWTPRPFDTNSPILWAEALSLTGGPSRLIPAAYCYFWPPEDPQGKVCLSDSNGCASGPDLESALCSGLLELIERDAVSIWWYNRAPRPALDLMAAGDSTLRETVARAEGEGWEVTILDVTTDFAVPVYVACLRHATGRFAVGSAAHPDASIAAYKAVAEAALVDFWSHHGGPQTPLSRWLASITPARHPQIVPTDHVPPRPRRIALRIGDQLEEVVRAIRRVGLQCYYVDLTRPETHYPVVRVVVPGLRPWNPRFGPGRLYDVPVQLGWLASAREECDLEQTPFAL
ncbi:MAG: TOMM precursor leader peptide-binding protein [Acidobacteria bacterium]|nr:TOMM precursor leader peptide-binding protein [Acidobacteriota bacterium]